MQQNWKVEEFPEPLRKSSRLKEKAQTNEEATVHVKDLTVQLLEDTPPVLSLGQLCEDHGYSYEWTGGQKPHFLTRQKIPCNTEELRAYSCLVSFERIFELQCGTPANYVFITGLNARGIHAETSEKKIETESTIGSRRLGAVS